MTRNQNIQNRVRRLGFYLVLLGILVFAILMLTSTLVFPGGSVTEPHALGYDFHRNYWCDLLSPRTVDGRVNARSPGLAQAGLLVLAVTLIPFWFVVSANMSSRLRSIVRPSGTLSAALMALDAALPKTFGWGSHAPIVLSAGGIGLFCASVCVAHSMRQRPRPASSWVGVLMLAFASGNILLYLAIICGHAERTWLLPTVQKGATICLLAWMLLAARAPSQSNRAPL